MKWAQAHKVGATLFELHIAANNFYNISARQQFLNKGLGDRHGLIVETTR